MRDLTASEQRLILQEHAQWDVVKGELLALLQSLVASNAPYVKPCEMMCGPLPFSTHIQFSAGWGTDATVTIHYRREPAMAGRKRYSLTTLSTEIGWSSTHRSVSQATTALAVYRRAVELAATVESMFCGEYWTEETDGDE
jgi:hypothetical protein